MYQVVQLYPLLLCHGTSPAKDINSPGIGCFVQNKLLFMYSCHGQTKNYYLNCSGPLSFGSSIHSDYTTCHRFIHNLQVTYSNGWDRSNGYNNNKFPHVRFQLKHKSKLGWRVIRWTGHTARSQTISKSVNRCVSLCHPRLFSLVGGASIDATGSCYYRICWTEKE